MARRERQILTGIEIGTATIKVVIGEIGENGLLEILGVGRQPSLRVIKGEIKEVPLVREQLERALSNAEHEARVTIGDMTLAVTGSHVKSVITSGTALVHDPAGRIGDDDVVEASRNARAYHLQPEFQPIHSLARNFRIDGQRELSNPTGQIGARVDADVLIVYGHYSRIEVSQQMLQEVMDRRADEVCFAPIAASYAVFSREEMENGSLVLDIGAGVTEYAVFHGAGCYHCGQITVGCDHIANDLAIALGLPLPKCRLLLADFGRWGSLTSASDRRSRMIRLPCGDSAQRAVPVSTIEEIIRLRLNELLHCVRNDLSKQNALPRVNSGVRLCGGCAHIRGIEELVRTCFQGAVQVARARLVNGRQEYLNDPTLIVPIGLLRWARQMLDIEDAAPPSFWTQFRVNLSEFTDSVRRAFRF